MLYYKLTRAQGLQSAMRQYCRSLEALEQNALVHHATDETTLTQYHACTDLHQQCQSDIFLDRKTHLQGLRWSPPDQQG
jgi:hypothetical protein